MLVGKIDGLEVNYRDDSRVFKSSCMNGFMVSEAGGVEAVTI